MDTHTLGEAYTTSTPDWIRRPTLALDQLPHAPDPEVPDWLTTSAPTVTLNHKPLKELVDIEYTNMFETVLDQISQGIALTEILRSDHRETDSAKFMRWIHKDAQRKSRYFEAQEIGAELIASDMIQIADAADSIEDVQRSKLRIDTRKFLLGVWNKRRYGETKTIEVGGSISITEALQQAQMRVINDEIMDVELLGHDAET